MKGRVQVNLILLFTLILALSVNFQSFAAQVESGERGWLSGRSVSKEVGIPRYSPGGAFEADLPFVKKALEWEQLWDKTDFALRMKRLERYEDMIRSVLQSQGVPEEFIFVSLVESGGHHRARSKDRSGAVGLWQLVPSTARMIGLTVSRRVDERLDPFKSTFAVARFFRELYETFHSWPLVLVAYNMGEYALKNKLAKGEVRDFADLWKRGAIPKQTRNYVLKVYAAARLGRRLTVQEEETLTYAKEGSYWSMLLTESVEVQRLATALDVPLDVLMCMNPLFPSPSYVIQKGSFVNIPLEAKERYMSIWGYGGLRY